MFNGIIVVASFAGLAVRSLVGSGFHSSSTAVAGENYRLRLPTSCMVYDASILSLCRHGLARSGNEYGPLTDVPDWSFAGKDGRNPYYSNELCWLHVHPDGRTAPVSKAQKHRNKRQYAIGVSA